MTINLPIDHIGVVCTDIVHTRNAFLETGFLVTPIDVLHTGTEQQESGKNCHIYLKNSYVELISDSASYLAEFRAPAPGMHILVLSSDDIPHSMARLRDAGIACSDCYRAERPAHGKTARFDWFRIETPLVPHMLVAVVHHLTPELIFPSGDVAHKNTANLLEHIELIYPESEMPTDIDLLSRAALCLDASKPSYEYPRLQISRSSSANPLGHCRLGFRNQGRDVMISERLHVIC